MSDAHEDHVLRALTIADAAAEELVRSEGEPASEFDTFVFEAEAVLADDNVQACIDHLVWRGIAKRVDDEKRGDVIVVFGDE